MKLKLDESGAVIVRNDKPVYETSNGNEIEFDALSTTNTIQNLTRERDALKGDNKTLLEGADKFKDFDMDQATSDRDIVKNLDDKQLIDSGEVEKIKTQMSEVFDAERVKFNSDLLDKDILIDDLMIGSRFSGSPYLRDNIILPPDMCRDWFGRNFRVEVIDKKPVVVGYIGDNKIYSQVNAGELAEFEEAIQVIVGNYEMKDRIIKSSDKGGSGSAGGSSNNNNSNSNSPAGKLSGTRQERTKAIADRFPELNN